MSSTSLDDRTQAAVCDEPEVRQPQQWHVVLIDDDDHTYEYVMLMMQQLFRVPIERAFQIARTVDGQGRAVCLTTHKEHAELKRDQIHGFGRDPLMASCAGSMSAVIEPAEFAGDEDDDGDGSDDAPGV